MAIPNPHPNHRFRVEIDGVANLDYSEVILPEETRQQLYEALTQIEKHRLIFSDWGLGERHPVGAERRLHGEPPEGLAVRVQQRDAIRLQDRPQESGDGRQRPDARDEPCA